MYRRYIITGMNKKIQKLPVLLWGLAAAGSRGLYFFLKGSGAVDTYEYYAHSMIRQGESGNVFSSGLSAVYTEHLSVLLRFAGNRIEAVCVYQMILQILWLLFLFAGLSMLFGRLTGAVAGSLAAVSPWILSTIFVVSPENFFMFYFSMALLLSGYHSVRAGAGRWSGNFICTLYILAEGVFGGILVSLNYLGWLYVALALYVLIKNPMELKKNVQQFTALVLGTAIGVLAALLNFAGRAQDTVGGQLLTWVLQLKELPGRCQETGTELTGWVLGALAAGIVCRSISNLIRRQKASSALRETSEEPKAEAEEKQENYIITEDGRKIKLLDNPLPVPKRHVRKEMNFDIDDDTEPMETEDDFDHVIRENDDFDI